MCGIIGYVGSKDAGRVILGGLRRLEYRGYDSAGVAVANRSGLQVVRAAGRVAELARLEVPRGIIGIGHTRWATHGRPEERNAHPHCDCTGDFAVVHNGIIENHVELREQLGATGHVFRSDTDTEVLAHLVEEAYEGDIVAALRDALERVKGSCAAVLLSNREPETLVAARRRSPLLVGLCPDGNIVASDATAVLEHTRRVVHLAEGQIARVRPSDVSLFDKWGKPSDLRWTHVEWSLEEAEKGGFEHFMLKEIHEIPRALQTAFQHRLDSLDSVLELDGPLKSRELASCDAGIVVACGTSYHAGLIGKMLIERIAKIPVDVQLASEYRYAPALVRPRTFAVCVSQSGETADTLEAMHRAKTLDHRTLAISNVVGSTMAREADGVFYMRAGPEIGVAATKTFVNTLASFYMIALHLGSARGTLEPAQLRRHVYDMRALPRTVQQVIEAAPRLRALANEHLVKTEHAFFIGRQLSYGAALEGALKLKEISYVHAEGYAAGELKHGPLALIQAGVPVIGCAPRDEAYNVMMSNLVEVRARDARVVAIVDEEDHDAAKSVDAVVPIPRVDPMFFPVPSVVAMYLMSYYTALARGCQIDNPRNLAKSVTVE